MDNLNIRNIKITEKDVNNMFKNVGINKVVNDISKYQHAFTHKSYVKDTANDFLNDLISLKDGVVEFQDECNERLEFYGDSFVGSTTVKYLFHRYPEFNEGMLTKLKTQIVSRYYLAKFARFHGFEKFLLLSNHMENIHGRDGDRLLEDCFEAFIGAIELDLGEITGKEIYW